MFIAGVLLFGAASLAAGLAVSELMLVLARAGQGLAAALVSPAALALLTTTFHEGRERDRALGVFGAVASAGGASGLLLGGVITEWAGWRWVFFVNVPIAAGTAVAAPLILTEARRNGVGRLDLAGAVTITMALVAGIYGIARADQDGLADPLVVASLIGAVALGTGFVFVERRATDPLVPFRLLRLPTMMGADLTSCAVSTVVSSVPFFLSLYIQRVLDLSPIETGLAFLPMALTIMAASATAARLAQPIGVKPLLLGGLVALVLATALLSRLSPGGSYARDVLPGMVLFAVGLGLSYTTATIGATAGVPDADQGLAAGLLNTFNQVGGAIGLTVLAAIATRSGGAPERSDMALVEGLDAAFLAASGLAATGVLIATILVRSHDCDHAWARRRSGVRPLVRASTVGCAAGLTGRIVDGR
jgi:MFS family permease